jgi:hypothetical protein
LEYQDCAGNTESLLRASKPTVAELVLDVLSLDYHETVMAPAGHDLRLKPANLADPTGVAQKPLDYWFWRVSEGGTAEPFHSQGSVMPAWKYHLSEIERWQVIAFARTLHVAKAK